MFPHWVPFLLIERLIYFKLCKNKQHIQESLGELRSGARADVSLQVLRSIVVSSMEFENMVFKTQRPDTADLLWTWLSTNSTTHYSSSILVDVEVAWEHELPNRIKSGSHISREGRCSCSEADISRTCCRYHVKACIRDHFVAIF